MDGEGVKIAARVAEEDSRRVAVGGRNGKQAARTAAVASLASMGESIGGDSVSIT
jgi:hypothetical protein